MILSMENQAVIFLTTVTAGFAIGFIYDIFRVLRKILPHPSFLTQIEDILFWIIVSLGMFYVMLNRNFGEIRAFNVLGAIIGVVLYFNTVSILFMAASTAIINFCKKVVRLVFMILTAPFRFAYRLLKIPANFVGNFMKKRLIAFKKLLRKWKNYAKIRARSILGEMRIIFKKV